MFKSKKYDNGIVYKRKKASTGGASYGTFLMFALLFWMFANIYFQQ